MSIVFDRAVSFYDQTRGLPAQAEHDLARLLRDHTDLSANSAVLETGVGTGRIALPLIRENRYRYTGVDLSQPMMHKLHHKAADVPIALVQGDLAALPFRDRSFDAVVAVHIFHLVEAWQQAMDQIERVLRPDGVLLQGSNHHIADEANGESRLRQKLNDLIGRDDRAAAGLLHWNEVRPQLRQRFGEPHVYRTGSWQVDLTPRSILDQFRGRIWSWTWSLTNDQIERAADQAQTWAIEEFGSLDAPLIHEQRFEWEIFDAH